MKPWALVLLCAASLAYADEKPANGPLTIDVAAIDRGRIVTAANVALKMAPISLTAFPPTKTSLGNRNDFYSNADYWWPNPNKPDGLPYVQRDGQSNPQIYNWHRLAMRDLRDAVAALGAAYKITGEERDCAEGRRSCCGASLSTKRPA